MRVTLFNPDVGGQIFRTIKFNQHKVSWANYLRTGTFAATAIMEVYELERADE